MPQLFRSENVGGLNDNYLKALSLAVLNEWCQGVAKVRRCYHDPLRARFLGGRRGPAGIDDNQAENAPQENVRGCGRRHGVTIAEERVGAKRIQLDRC